MNGGGISTLKNSTFETMIIPNPTPYCLVVEYRGEEPKYENSFSRIFFQGIALNNLL
jgi:hypothetical protein